MVSVVAERRLAYLPSDYMTARPKMDDKLVVPDTGCTVAQYSAWLPLTGDHMKDGKRCAPPAGWLLLAAVLLADPLTICQTHLNRLLPMPASDTSPGLHYPEGLNMYPCIASGGFSFVFDARWRQDEAGALPEPVVIKIARSKGKDLARERDVLKALQDASDGMVPRNTVRALQALRACILSFDVHDTVAASTASAAGDGSSSAAVSRPSESHGFSAAHMESIKDVETVLHTLRTTTEAADNDALVKALCAWPLDVALLSTCDTAQLLAAALKAGRSRLPCSLADAGDYLVVAPKGVSLQEKVATLGTPEGKVDFLRRAMRDVLLALVRAHALGHVQRDVRVPNIIWVDDAEHGGRAVLIDWGISCHQKVLSDGQCSPMTDIHGVISTYETIRTRVLGLLKTETTTCSGPMQETAEDRSTQDSVRMIQETNTSCALAIDSFSAALRFVVSLCPPSRLSKKPKTDEFGS
ncbi:MAG: hypothetical protein EOO65_04550 [Methanosarcinales archaeon]|nr:MAG: hypothetical protein EOO65_04550 [Methanosarcinales archaeon]